MKRSDELSPLSRQHHVALETALRLRRAADHDADAVRASTLDFWNEEGREHLRLEEELLLPAFAVHVPAGDPDVLRVLVDHVELRSRVAALEDAHQTDLAALHDLGERLDAHVRHEERTLFPRIEAALTPGELAAVGAALSAAGSAHRPPRA